MRGQKHLFCVSFRASSLHFSTDKSDIGASECFFGKGTKSPTWYFLSELVFNTIIVRHLKIKCFMRTCCQGQVSWCGSVFSLFFRGLISLQTDSIRLSQSSTESHPETESLSCETANTMTRKLSQTFKSHV